jgi:uncharacterized membrane protein
MPKNNPAKKNPSKDLSSIEMRYEGPLPPGAELQKYEQLAPGAAETIISNFLHESQHRREMEQRDQNMDAHFLDRTLKANIKGLYFAAASVALTLGVGTFFMLMGYPNAGASIICTVVVGIAACFVYGSRGIVPKNRK